MNSSIIESLLLTRRTLRKNRVRTFLSVLGIAIGITSLVAIMSAGVSLRRIFEEQLDQFGSNFVQVEVKIPNASQHSSSNATGIAQGISITTLSLDDKESIDALPNINESYAAVLGQASMTSVYAEKNLNYFAVSPEFQNIDTAGIAAGRFYEDDDERSLSKVLVLGSEAAQKLFPNQDPIGQTVKVQRIGFRVIGVMNERGSTGFVSMDDWVFIPLRTAQKLLLGYDHLSFILAQMNDPSVGDATAEEMKDIIRINHAITDPVKDDFAVTTQEQGLETVGTILSGITLVLSIIASIALVVGGVGIMNIMYVAVNERIFEIGLRKALGATMRHIRNQFLLEAVVITVIGAIFGIVLAVVLIALIFLIAGYFDFSWPFAVSIKSVVLALIFSSILGVSFGYYPAKRAASLKPVEALAQKRGA
ncbi:MAG: ABC transporter permease [Candidatus Komeilibacteria bacterium]|nr:ABC transporter permease [Candidatus Komeilibacteria bacterium]